MKELITFIEVLTEEMEKWKHGKGETFLYYSHKCIEQQCEEMFSRQLFPPHWCRVRRNLIKALPHFAHTAYSILLSFYNFYFNSDLTVMYQPLAPLLCKRCVQIGTFKPLLSRQATSKQNWMSSSSLDFFLYTTKWCYWSWYLDWILLVQKSISNP